MKIMVYGFLSKLFELPSRPYNEWIRTRGDLLVIILGLLIFLLLVPPLLIGRWRWKKAVRALKEQSSTGNIHLSTADNPGGRLANPGSFLVEHHAQSQLKTTRPERPSITEKAILASASPQLQRNSNSQAQDVSRKSTESAATDKHLRNEVSILNKAGGRFPAETNKEGRWDTADVGQRQSRRYAEPKAELNNSVKKMSVNKNKIPDNGKLNRLTPMISLHVEAKGPHQMIAELIDEISDLNHRGSISNHTDTKKEAAQKALEAVRAGRNDTAKAALEKLIAIIECEQHQGYRITRADAKELIDATREISTSLS